MTEDRASVQSNETVVGAHPPPDEFAVAQPLQQKLIRSHLAVASIGFAVLLVTLFSLLTLRNDTLRLARLRGPTVRVSNQIRAGVQRSLASLRGWMVVADEDLKRERRDAWRLEIEDRLEELNLSLIHI